MIGSGGDDQRDGATGMGLHHQRPEENLVWQKIRRDDQQAAIGLLDHGQDAFVKRVAGYIRPWLATCKIARAARLRDGFCIDFRVKRNQLNWRRLKRLVRDEYLV